MWNFFDKITVLNQRKRTDRLHNCLNEFSRVGLRAEIFYSLDHENAFESFCNSQVGLLNDFLFSGAKTLLALEDDVKFKNIHDLETALNELPEDWDIVYLGANVTEEKPEYYSKHLRRVRSAWTTHAIGYSRKAVEKILQGYKNWKESGMYDDWLSREFLPLNKCYIIAPMMAWQRPVFSDIWNTNVSYGWEQIELKLL